MKVSVYKRDDGVTSVLVQPGRSAHLAPVLLQVKSREGVRAAVKSVLDAVNPEMLAQGRF